MYTDNKAWIGTDNNGNRVELTPKLANRHGLVAGATGTGKTVTLKVMAETFSDMGVPVFVADVKGDIAGLCRKGYLISDLLTKAFPTTDTRLPFGISSVKRAYLSGPLFRRWAPCFFPE